MEQLIGAHHGPTLPPELGRHDPPPLAPVPSRVITTWPAGTFVENLAPLPTGDVVVSVLSDNRLDLVSPDGSQRVLASTPAPPAGVVVYDDACFVLAGEPGTGPYQVLRVGFDGRVVEWLPVPDARWLNGFTLVDRSTAYTVDSVLGTVVRVDLHQPGARTVLRHDLLVKSTTMPGMPAVNGIAVRDDDLILTNTERAQVMRARPSPDGSVRGLEVIADHLRGDDLAVAPNGDLYVATHIHNTVVRLARDGGRVAVAGPDDGMAGATACAFGTSAQDMTSLYVTTTGGAFMPLDGIPQPAKLVRLDITDHR
jgi:hypothetical protein